MKDLKRENEPPETAPTDAAPEERNEEPDEEPDEELNEELNAALTDVDGRFVAEALAEKERAEAGKKPRRRAKIILRVAIAAAVAALLIGASFGAYAAVTEYREYQTALTFFSEHDLEAAGLTREEIKAVYHDIESGTFRLEKTAEVIMRRMNLSENVVYSPGTGLMDASALRTLWEAMPLVSDIFTSDSEEAFWQYDFLEEKDGSVLRKYQNRFSEEALFEKEFEGFDITGLVELSDGALLYGNPSNRQTGVVAKVDGEGNLLWKDVRSDYGMKFEYFTAAFEREDGSYVFIGTCRRSTAPDHENALSFCVYSPDGAPTLFSETVLPGVSPLVRTAVPLKDDFIVQVSRSPEREQNSILRVNKLGEITENYYYERDDRDFFIGGVSEDDKTIRLSVTLVERPEHTAGYFTDLREVLDDYMAQRTAAGNYDPPTAEELTDYFCSKISGMILYLNKETGGVDGEPLYGGVIAGKIRMKPRSSMMIVDFYIPLSIVYLPGCYTRYLGTADRFSIETGRIECFSESIGSESGEKELLNWG